MKKLNNYINYNDCESLGFAKGSCLKKIASRCWGRLKGKNFRERALKKNEDALKY